MRTAWIVLPLMTMLIAPWLPEAWACPAAIEPAPATVAVPASTMLPVRAVSLDFSELARSPDDLDRLEQRMRNTGVNMVGLSAGRIDWTGFRWSEREERWSAAVRNSGRDLLAEATQRFGGWAHVSAIVDVFAPRYLEEQPAQRALDTDGRPIPYQASIHALVNGPFGDELIAMIDYIARHYAVDSIALTELFYYEEGYGADDLALYRQYSGQRDWPRTPRGSINVDHPTVGAWRSAMVAQFVERAARVVHAHGKQLFVDVRVDWEAPQYEGRRSGHDYALLLQYADRLVLWNYFGLSNASPAYTRDIARYVQRYGAERIIISYGLWADHGAVVDALDLRRAMIAGQKANLPNAWITPASLMEEEHWQVLMSVWRRASPPILATTPPQPAPGH